MGARGSDTMMTSVPLYRVHWGRSKGHALGRFAFARRMNDEVTRREFIGLFPPPRGLGVGTSLKMANPPIEHR